MGKKISRGIGYAVCVLLLILCIFLIVTSSLFGARGAVDIFGFNVYIAETDEFESVSEGSAVIVRRCEAYELEENELVLYMRAEKPALGYVDGAETKDGVYTVTVSDGEGQHIFEETALIGSADLSSAVLGAIIRFSQTGWGICVIAVLPCLALIIYDIIRAAAAKLPPPEVVPKMKNEREQGDNAGQGSVAISVKSDGRGAISRRTEPKPVSGADSILFSYAGKQQTPANRGDDRRPEIIPLSKPIAPPKKSTEELLEKFAERRSTKPEPIKAPKNPPPAEEDIPEEPVPVKTAAAVGTPPPVAARRYLDNAVEPPKASGATAEIPELPKRSKNDAFFAQSEVPQIGRKSHRGAIKPDTEAYSGRRSSVILAQKSRSELISDDDDALDKGRYEVDDILAGLEKRKKK